MESQIPASSVNVDERLSQLEQQAKMAQDRLARLSSQMEQTLRLLTSDVAPQVSPSLEERGPGGPLLPGFTSRRDLLKNAAMMTFGAAALWETTSKAQASSNSNYLQLGLANTGSAVTSLTASVVGTSASPTGGAATLEVFNTNSGVEYLAAIYGSCGAGSGVLGVSTSGYGVAGFSTSGSGLYGGTQSTNSGIYALSTGGSGIEATGGTYGALLTGTLAPICLEPGPTNSDLSSPYSDARAHETGELFVDSTGSLWYCAVGGAPGSWRKLAGSTTAGSLALLPAPTRFIDTRSSSASYTPGVPAPAPGSAVVTYIFTGTNALIPYTPQGSEAVSIPHGATALIGRMTVGNGENGHTTSPNGELKVSNINPPGFGSGLVTWGSTPSYQIVPFVLALDNSSGTGGQMYFVNISPTDQIDLIMDVTGYYF